MKITVIEDGFVLVSQDADSPDAVTSDANDNKPIHLTEISDIVDCLSNGFWPVNKKIHDNPELHFKEFIAHEALTAYMRSCEGWEVTPSAYDMATAWIAVFDSGRAGPVVSFNAEMDALPGIGHACGHNLIATASVVGAVATAEMMERHDIPGKVVLFGTPAEESGGGKIRLLQAGAYADHKVDLNLISHPGIVADCALMRTTAISRLKVEYFGRESHAAANPWLGINALDALVAGYNNVSMLRQQTMPGDVIQGYFTDTGTATNIIHAYAAGRFTVRANTQKRLEELEKKVVACFQAGATATGAKIKLTMSAGYKDHVPNRALARLYTPYFNALSPPNEIPFNQDLDEINGRTQASTDQGDISHAMPSLSVGFSVVPGPNGMGPHSPEFAEAAGTKDAFLRALRVGKALAGTALNVLLRPNLLDEIKSEWEYTVGSKQ